MYILLIFLSIIPLTSASRIYNALQSFLLFKTIKTCVFSCHSYDRHAFQTGLRSFVRQHVTTVP